MAPAVRVTELTAGQELARIFLGQILFMEAVVLAGEMSQILASLLRVEEHQALRRVMHHQTVEAVELIATVFLIPVARVVLDTSRFVTQFQRQ